MASIIEELRELEAKATPGEWSYYAGTVSAPKRKDFPNESPTFQTVSCVYQRDAALIAAMRNALPSLLTRLEALEWLVEVLQAWHDLEFRLMGNNGGKMLRCAEDELRATRDAALDALEALP